MNRDLLKEQRDKKDLSNDELARRAGIKPGYLDNLICGADQPSPRLLHRLERVLELPEDALKATTTNEPPAKKEPKAEPVAPPKRQDPTAPKRVARQAVA
ncbi:helix-turn-helix domain-containing protein [Amycolatopsis thermoflava]|uniref:helix-turn-helix domain-containing protein n=1 Tax=Amycolatopsis thermoflava TaxID=84480 RepID=UPI0038223765